MKRFRFLVALVVAGVGLVVAAPAASAHPLGNFTVNTYGGVRVAPDRVIVDYVVDMAEIPAFQTRPQVDAAGPAAWAAQECASLAGGLRISLAGRALVARSSGGRVTFPPGTAGLSTLRLECDLSARFAHPIAGDTALRYADTNFTGRVGWRETTAVGDGATLLSSNVPASSTSARLTAYPSRSPLDVRRADIEARPGGAAAPAPGSASVRPAARGVDGLTRSFTSLVGRRHIGIGFGFAALALAIGLGAIHALAPGHGKTVMAAYLVGQRGSPRQGLLIGVTVALTHTGGVLALGLVLSASQAAAPERVYPWLGLASGLLLASIGAGLLLRARRGGAWLVPSHHHHVHHDGHDHEPHAHPHHHPDHHHHDHEEQVPVSRRALVAMGFAGGMVPSPSALVVLLGAIALGRTWFGALLVLAYGLGMAATLVGAGLLLLRARARLDGAALTDRSPRLVAFARAIPTVTATMVLAGGTLLMARAAVSL